MESWCGALRLDPSCFSTVEMQSGGKVRCPEVSVFLRNRSCWYFVMTSVSQGIFTDLVPSSWSCGSQRVARQPAGQRVWPGVRTSRGISGAQGAREDLRPDVGVGSWCLNVGTLSTGGEWEEALRTGPWRDQGCARQRAPGRSCSCWTPGCFYTYRSGDCTDWMEWMLPPIT